MLLVLMYIPLGTLAFISRIHRTVATSDIRDKHVSNANNTKTLKDNCTDPNR